MNIDFAKYSLLLPEAIVVGTFILLIVLDILMPAARSRRFFGWLALVAMIAAGLVLIWEWQVWKTDFQGQLVLYLQATYLFEAVSVLLKLLITVATIFVLLISLSREQRPFRKYEGEFYALILIAAFGGWVIVSSADLITLFVGLEILSIASYILVGLRKKNKLAVEAAWKYVILGGVSSAFILYGMSFLYGITGTTNLLLVPSVLQTLSQPQLMYYVYVSFFLMMVGFGFKMSAAPFHTWAADVYQGASTSVTTFLATATKVAAYGLLLRTLLLGYLPSLYPNGWLEYLRPTLIVMAVLSMIIGNVLALRQTDAKRLMAYSGIAQIGYILIPLALINIAQGFLLFRITFFYLIAYVLMVTGAFAIIAHVSAKAGKGEIRSFAGLYRRSPLLAFAMSVFLISLAGFPITAGFMGKFFILSNALSSVQGIIVGATMILTTVLSYFYYFRFIRQMYFRQSDDGETMRSPWMLRIVVTISLIGTIILALAPQLLLRWLEQLGW